MIGQTKLINQLTTLAKTKQLPRFIILVGSQGSGKKILCKLLKVLTGFDFNEVGTKVDDIRAMINKAYTNQTPTIYAIYDADNMSENAKNSMLKICEEPTNSAYIVMTLQNIENTLATIKSRASIFNLEPYTQEELMEYYHTMAKGDEYLICNICETPGQINEMVNLGIVEFDNYVKSIVDNINLVSDSNAFKIESKLSLNGEDDKYNLNLFFKAFMYECLTRIKANVPMYSFGVKVTCKYLQDLRYPNLNKTMLFDNWLLELRDGWLEYAESDT